MGRQGWLSVYAGVVSGALVFVLLTAAAGSQQRFTHLQVERLDIVEPDGTLRMVISDHAHLPGVIVRGKEHAEARPQAGMLFYNDEGSENGGLIFGGRRDAKGKVHDSGGSLSFDRYDANQVIQLAGVDDDEDRFAGLTVTDSRAGMDNRRRVWVGRREDGAATLALMDGNGKKRLVIQVAADGKATFSLLDAAGKVVREMLSANAP